MSRIGPKSHAKVVAASAEHMDSTSPDLDLDRAFGQEKLQLQASLSIFPLSLPAQSSRSVFPLAPHGGWEARPIS